MNATFVAFNRGKRSVELDLKDPQGRRDLFALVDSADVLVENFRPGVMDRLGIDAATLRARNPRLVHCSITGFGSSGPYKDLPAFDGVAMGYSGLAGLLLDPEDPQVRGPAMSDAITGHSAAFAILAALHERERTGAGAHLEISMMGALTHFLHSAVAKQVVEGREEGPYTRPHGSGTHAFRTADGRAVIIHLSSPPKFWEGLCHAVGRPELIEDPRFRTRPDRRERYDELHAELAPAFITRGRDEWLAELQRHQVPCAPVNGIADVLADPQMQHLGIIDVVEEPEIGSMPQIRPPAAFDGEMLAPVHRAPYLGEHTEALLEEARSRSGEETS